MHHWHDSIYYLDYEHSGLDYSNIRWCWRCCHNWAPVQEEGCQSMIGVTFEWHGKFLEYEWHPLRGDCILGSTLGVRAHSSYRIKISFMSAMAVSCWSQVVCSASVSTSASVSYGWSSLSLVMGPVGWSSCGAINDCVGEQHSSAGLRH